MCNIFVLSFMKRDENVLHKYLGKCTLFDLTIYISQEYDQGHFQYAPTSKDIINRYKI